MVVGVVSALQFDVLKHRLNHECNMDIQLESLPYQYIRWVSNDAVDPKTPTVTSGAKEIQNLKGHHLLLFASKRNVRWVFEHSEGLELTDFDCG